MKIALTADLHLTNQNNNPERFNALRKILQTMVDENIKTMVIAGDLFDQDAQAYQDFEDVVNEKSYDALEIIIINGNHDIGLKEGMIKSGRVKVFNKAHILLEDEYGVDILLLPFQREKRMGELIGEFKAQLKPENWVLAAHGEWIGGFREPNVYEPGIYMPLTRRDIDLFQPSKAILGHIHKAFDSERVIIPGSPCGVDITETGIRSFIVLDTNTMQTERINIETDVIFFNERLVLFPMPEEESYVSAQIAHLIESWDIPEEDLDKIVLRLKVEGYCVNPKAVNEMIENAFRSFQIYKDERIDFSDLKVSEDLEKNYIAEALQEEIASLNLPAGVGEPTKDDVYLSALHVIFGR